MQQKTVSQHMTYSTSFNAAQYIFSVSISSVWLPTSKLFAVGLLIIYYEASEISGVGL